MIPRARIPTTLALAALLLGAGAVGCASSGGPEIRTRDGVVVHDPLQPMNRGIFWFNDKLDRYALEPVAKGWNFIVPDPAQRGIQRFFSNLRFPVNFLNSWLQWKPLNAGLATGRFLVNSTLGLAGFLDPAKDWFGWYAHDEDFGQTLAVWGVGSGPYLVLPLIGPSSPRDAVGLGADTAASPLFWVPEEWFWWVLGGNAVNVVNTRSLNLDTIREARESSLDYYVLVRNAYFDYRENLIRDGQPPESTGSEDLYYPTDDSEDGSNSDAPK